ncbi:MAG: hypothetical protein ACW98F_11795 [Candidatus Hodarchaeales archaeon]
MPPKTQKAILFPENISIKQKIAIVDKIFTDDSSVSDGNREKWDEYKKKYYRYRALFLEYNEISEEVFSRFFYQLEDFFLLEIDLTSHCKSCNEAINPFVKSCPKCGHILSQETYSPTPESQSKFESQFVGKKSRRRRRSSSYEMEKKLKSIEKNLMIIIVGSVIFIVIFQIMNNALLKTIAMFLLIISGILSFVTGFAGSYYFGWEGDS